MNSKERVLKAINFGSPDRIPVIPFVMQFAAKVAGVGYRDYCKTGEKMADAQYRCWRKFGYDGVNVSSDAHRLAEALGGKVAFPEDGVPYVAEPPIKTREDLQTAQVPEPLEFYRTKERIKAVEILSDELSGKVPIIGWVEGALSDASSIHGFQQTLAEFYKNPAFLDELLEFSANFDTKFAKAQIEAGADVVGVGDSLASQISSRHFERVLARTRRIFEEIRAGGAHSIYHVCGDTTHQLELLGDSGADIIDLDWQVDLAQAKKTIGKNACIRGNFNPVELVYATPGRIEELCKRCIKTAGDGGYILSAGCEVPPETSEGNFRAMVESVKK